jgi:hypothetical protein
MAFETWSSKNPKALCCVSHLSSPMQSTRNLQPPSKWKDVKIRLHTRNKRELSNKALASVGYSECRKGEFSLLAVTIQVRHHTRPPIKKWRDPTTSLHIKGLHTFAMNSPSWMCKSVPQTPQALTLIRTSFARSFGKGTSTIPYSSGFE